MRIVSVYRCPVHGLIESPSLYTEEDAAGVVFNSELYCPVNLTGKDGRGPGITDEVCGATVTGPITVVQLRRARGSSKTP